MRARDLSGRLQTLATRGHHPAAGWPYHRRQSARPRPAASGSILRALGRGSRLGPPRERERHRLCSSLNHVFAASPACAASISHNASGAASYCSSDIALTPLEGSTFISFGTSIAHILRYAAGCSFATFTMTFAPCSKCSAIVSKNRLLGTPANFA
jgi:hypothetical protein